MDETVAAQIDCRRIFIVECNIQTLGRSVSVAIVFEPYCSVPQQGEKICARKGSANTALMKGSNANASTSPTTFGPKSPPADRQSSAFPILIDKDSIIF